MFGLLRRDREKTQEGVKKSRETWFGRIVGLFRAPRLDDALWEELEEILISADVGVNTTVGLIQHLKERAQRDHLNQPQQLLETLKGEMVALLESDGQQGVPWMDNQEVPRPFVILVVGVNGVGKTTCIAKLAYQFQEMGKKVILGAADTFRAAAIEQLQIWGQRVGAEVVAHRLGADPGAVAFDAYQAARARGADLLIIDTAGRLHTKHNLMEELKKIKRVLGRLDPTAPHQVLLVLDATTGHNGLNQARYFAEAVECNGVFLAKLDGTAKGGIVLAIRHELKLPILFIGTGEKPQDMAPFDSREFVEALLTPVP